MIEDLIVTESFAPVLDLYAKHPTWGVDIELQGYFLDVLAARHPKVLDQLRTLAKSGQIDVVSFHYSDQLFIGYPEEDWLRSQALTAATFAKYDIPLSRTVFCQEGQAGEGMAARMASLGYRNMVWPKNLWSYQHGDFDAAPLYDFGDVYLVAGAKGVSFQQGSLDISVTWTYLDDGELMATNGLNPYTPDALQDRPGGGAEVRGRARRARGPRLQARHRGRVRGRREEPRTPRDAATAHGRHLAAQQHHGGLPLVRRQGHLGRRARQRGAVFGRARAPRAGGRRDCREGGGHRRTHGFLDGAWRLLFLSEVSDASGINPFRGEVEYGIAHATEAARIARDVIRRAKTATGAGSVVIDPESGSMTPGSEPDLRGKSEVAPLALGPDAGDRELRAAWELVAPGLHRVEIGVGAGSSTKIAVRFTGELVNELVTTRALADDAVATYQRDEFSFESFQLALPTGLVSLGPKRFLIEDQAVTHLAAKMSRDSGDIELRDDTLLPDETATWVFYVYDGAAADALALARRINVNRRLSR